MKILYGVVGEGMGHAIRSGVILEKLARDGHELHVVASGRAHSYVQERIQSTSRIWGLTMAMQDNALDKSRTAAENLRAALGGLPHNVRQYFEVLERFSPDLVISDFESWSWLFARVHRLPLICIDNIQVLHRCRHPEDVIGPDGASFRLARAVVKAKCPRASHYLVTSFFDAPLRKKRTTLVPPILRERILTASPRSGDHLLVYQTSESFSGLPEVLRRLDRPVHIYGLRRNLKEDVVEGNLVFRPFSEQGFVDDLASCAGVIASAGYTLIGEALHFGKPYLATPVGKQFEQTLNARYIERLGYGMCEVNPSAADIAHFVAHLDQYRARLADYPRQDNHTTFEALEGLFDQYHAGLLRARL